MHSDPAEVQKKIRTYLTVFGMLMIFTILTVTASRFHFAVPVAVTVALVIAAMKGSMVAAVFMEGRVAWGRPVGVSFGVEDGTEPSNRNGTPEAGH